jgi:hypothetical protein
MGKGVKIQVKIASTLEHQLKHGVYALDAMTRLKVVTQSLKKAAEVAKAEMERTAPRGDTTGTSKKQSQSMKAKRKRPIREKLGVKAKENYAIAGPLYPDAAEVNPLIAGHEMVLWGRRPKETDKNYGKRVGPAPHFIKLAAESTQDKQRQVLDAEIVKRGQKELQKMARR